MKWVSLLKKALDTEYGDAPRICMLGTSDTDCIPHLRSVVIRSIDEHGRLHIASDARSKKNEQVKENPAGAIAIWLPSLRAQFRIEGTIDVIGWATVDQSLRRQTWQELSDATRAMFAWPGPGMPRKDQSNADEASLFPAAKSARTPIPESFDLIRINPRMVESLLVQVHPHERVCWKSPEWTEERINP